jgi:type I restriction enzyme S subunit
MVPSQKLPWPEVRLGDILTERTEMPDPVEIETGMIPIVAKVSFSEGTIELRDDTRTRTKMILIRPGDLVVSGINAAKGAIAIYDEEDDSPIAATIHYAAYIPDKSRVDVRYLWWLLRSETFRNILKRNLPGGVKTELKAKRLLPIQVPLPALDEQRRIVARIEELAALIEEAQGLRAKAREEAEALLKAASADAFGQLGLSDDQWVDLGNVTERITKGESPGWQGFSYVNDGPLFIRSKNVLWGQLDLSSETRIPLAFHKKLSRSQLRGRDVLINLVGASIGRSAVVPDDLGGANINQAVAVITPKQELDPRFLMLFLISPFAQRILHGGKVETARPNISLTDLRNLHVPVPSLDQQHSIVAHLDDLQAQVNELTTLQEATQAELDALLPSVLDRAFRGEL